MKIYLQMILLFSLLSLGSCKDWLDLQPEGQATSDELFTTGDGYRSVLAGIYQAMASKNLYGVELQFGIVDCMSRQYTWNWNYNEQGPDMYKIAREFDYYNSSLRPTIDNIWKDGFNVVANANNLIQNLDGASPDLFAGGEPERRMILGEAYACRALMHFDLLRLFAPAPVHDEGEQRVPYVEDYPNIQPNGIGVKSFLEKVIRDLKTARSLTIQFDTTALGMSLSASGNARFYGTLESNMEGHQNENTVDGFYMGRGYRLSYYATSALLARVYQYAGMQEEAFRLADSVLNFKATGMAGVSYDMFSKDEFGDFQVDDYEQKKNLKAVSNLIFAVYNEEAYNDYSLGRFFQKRADGMNKGSWLMLDLDNQKIFQKTDGASDESEMDIRSKYLLFKPEDNSIWGNYKISAKWYCSDNLTIRKANVQILPVIRATEMRYIMAEYYARKQQFEQAYQILNQIRQNRATWAEFPVEGQEWGEWKTMEDLPVAQDYETFQKDLIRDAQREWISEGQLFYLYKRLGAKVYFKEDEIRELNKSEYMLPVPDNQSM
ncbi:RagB/SusD family nutrient uptake outer membrane protein [uncultured Butyricimonas sp.]|uniref:RagB/SusD family nutrient uptake outer membrane protein n=1 Tax=uncultured Butyricimonas sp. TaxID=1268785 RepID=UPI0026DD4DEB|nr:RagB/SusD family nutrient uptake outer membrane protein [uncultured Butyricimonas sp.]